MRELGLTLLSASVVLVISSVSLAQDRYVFGFQGGPDAIEANPGDVSSHKIQNTLTHSGDGIGAQGYSFSVVANNASITAIGTGVCNFPPGPMQTDCENDPDRPETKTRELFFGGFELSELTTSGTGECEGLAGAVSGISGPAAFGIVYPSNETSVIAEITVEIVFPVANDVATIRYVDGCQGSGQPIETIAVQDGLALTPAEREDKIIALDIGAEAGDGKPFNRGEVNGDGKHNISDAISIVKRVFGIATGFTPVDCADMFDVNDDDSFGLDDPLSLLNWIFKGGTTPPPPFKVCRPELVRGGDCNESNCIAP